MAAIGTADDIAETIFDRRRLDAQQVIPHHLDALPGNRKGNAADAALDGVPALADAAAQRVLGHIVVNRLRRGCGAVAGVDLEAETVGILGQQGPGAL
ncbi:hypothetical protein D9M71_613700 [compost metagenome]